MQDSESFSELSIKFNFLLFAVSYYAEHTLYGNDRVPKGNRFAFRENIDGEKYIKSSEKSQLEQ